MWKGRRGTQECIDLGLDLWVIDPAVRLGLEDDLGGAPRLLREPFVEQIVRLLRLRAWELEPIGELAAQRDGSDAYTARR